MKRGIGKLVYAGLGAALFVAVVSSFDLPAAAPLILNAGVIGVIGLCLAFFLAFALDTLLWHVLMTPLGLSVSWYVRLIRIRLVGEAFNLVIPAGSFGGEPMKAILLKNHYGVAYSDSSPALVQARIVAVVGQFVFACIALIVMEIALNLPGAHELTAWTGLLIFAFMTATFVLLPKLRLASRFARKLGGSRFWGFLRKNLTDIAALEETVNAFGRRHRVRSLVAHLISVLRWVVGAGEMWLAMKLLGHPVSLAEALVLEAILQLIPMALRSDSI